MGLPLVGGVCIGVPEDGPGHTRRRVGPLSGWLGSRVRLRFASRRHRRLFCVGGGPRSGSPARRSSGRGHRRGDGDGRPCRRRGTEALALAAPPPSCMAGGSPICAGSMLRVPRVPSRALGLQLPQSGAGLPSKEGRPAPRLDLRPARGCWRTCCLWCWSAPLVPSPSRPPAPTGQTTRPVRRRPAPRWRPTPSGSTLPPGLCPGGSP